MCGPRGGEAAAPHPPSCHEVERQVLRTLRSGSERPGGGATERPAPAIGGNPRAVRELYCAHLRRYDPMAERPLVRDTRRRHASGRAPTSVADALRPGSLRGVADYLPPADGDLLRQAREDPLCGSRGLVCPLTGWIWTHEPTHRRKLKHALPEHRRHQPRSREALAEHGPRVRRMASRRDFAGFVSK